MSTPLERRDCIELLMQAWFFISLLEQLCRNGNLHLFPQLDL